MALAPAGRASADSDPSRSLHLACCKPLGCSRGLLGGCGQPHLLRLPRRANGAPGPLAQPEPRYVQLASVRRAAGGRGAPWLGGSNFGRGARTAPATSMDTAVFKYKLVAAVSARPAAPGRSRQLCARIAPVASSRIGRAGRALMRSAGPGAVVPRLRLQRRGCALRLGSRGCGAARQQVRRRRAQHQPPPLPQVPSAAPWTRPWPAPAGDQGGAAEPGFPRGARRAFGELHDAGMTRSCCGVTTPAAPRARL